MIELSPAAAREIERWSQSRRLSGSYLRLAVKNGGCSGLHYHLELTSFPIIFYVHRSFSSLILFTNLWLGWKIYQQAEKNNLLLRMAYVLVGLVVTAILAGVSLDRLGFPALAQPIHLLMANLIFGAQFFIFICRRYSLSQVS